MSLYYPQGALTLRVGWEDFGKDDPKLKEIFTIRILARNITVEVNDYTEADTFNAEIDYKSFPFDPRTIRSCGVTVHLEDKKRVYSGNSIDELVPTEENTVFIGFVDEESISFDDNSRIVRLEGRDLSALLLDYKRRNMNPLPLSQPVDLIIASLMYEQKSTEKIMIEVRVDDDHYVIDPKFFGSVATTSKLPILSKLAPDFGKKSGNKNPKKNESYWDIIQHILEKAALIGYMELDKFIITRPNTLYSDSRAVQFIYGKNIKKLEMRRKLGRQKGFNVKVVSLSVEDKRLLESFIPKDAKDESFISRFGNEEVLSKQLDKEGKPIDPPKPADYLVFKVADIASKEQLIRIGENIFEEGSRQELEGSLHTLEMSIPEQYDEKNRYDNKPLNFNKIRVGTPIKLYMDQDDMDKLKTIKGVAQKRKFLYLRGFPKNIASAFAASIDRVHTRFYTKSVTYTLSQDDGFSMDLRFINFIELDNQNLGI